MTGTAPGASPQTRAAERTALTYVTWAGLLIIVAGVLSIAADLTTTATVGTLQFGPPFLLVSLATGVCELLVVVLFLLAFRKLATQDSRFSTPWKLALLLLVAIVIVLAALDALVSGLNTLETCVRNAGMNQTAQAACISGGPFLAVLAVVGVAGLVALVGFIGLLIGVWRLGARYQSSYFKVGAILLILPFLNIVGGVLILVAARSFRGAPGSATSF